MILALSEPVWNMIIGAVVTVVLAYMADRTKRAAEQAGNKAKQSADAAAGKVEEVKSDLQGNKTAIEGICKEVKQVHTLVNSKTAADLRARMFLAKRLWEGLGDPADKDLYEATKLAYDEHMAAQSKVDQTQPE